MKLFFYTSTGNNLYLSKKIGGEFFSIPKVLKEEKLYFEDNDAIGIIFPCHGLGTPRIVKEFLERASLNSPYIFAIMSYGLIAGAGTEHFLKEAERNNIKISYLNEIIMVDNYLPSFNMNEQKASLNKKEVEKHIDILINDINAKKKYIKKHSVFSKILTYFYQSYHHKRLVDIDKNFYVTEECVSCSICSKVCPNDNIVVDKSPLFNGLCDECFACAQNCPKNAILVKGEKDNSRFINENVKTSEIISANN